MLVMETAVLGVFLSLNLVLYYLFWEGMLIPMYFIIGIWGGQRRVYATVKFFLYTMAGSMVMLVSIMALYFLGGSTTFDLPALQQHVSPVTGLFSGVKSPTSCSSSASSSRSALKPRCSHSIPGCLMRTRKRRLAGRLYWSP